MNMKFFFLVCFFSFLNVAGWADEEPTDIFIGATKEYGALKVKVGSFTTASKIIPWSSWWFPTKDDFLIRSRNGEQPTLKRYDDLVYFNTAPRLNPQSQIFEEQNLYNPNAEGWFGLCDAWALASIMEPEPRVGLRYKNIDFRVADLKALIIKTYDGVEGLKQFGQKFSGGTHNFDTDGNEPRFLDIYPQQFHRFLQKELYEKGMPFLMDYDPGIQVWTVPVYRASTTVTRPADYSDRVYVRTTIFFADSKSVRDYNFVGSDENPNKEEFKRYLYTLYGTWGNEGGEDVFFVSNGEWTYELDATTGKRKIGGIDSRIDHPDYLIPRPTSLVRKSLNQNLKIEWVDKITQREERMKNYRQ